MNIQTRKLHFVQEFLRINDEDLVGKFEEILREKRLIDYEKSLSPMKIDELNKIIDAAEDDSSNGRLISANDLKKEIDSWI